MSPFRTHLAAFAALPMPVRGAIWMIGAGFCFAAMNAIIRVLSTEIHPFEVAFLRNLGGLAFMLPWLLRTRFRGLRTSNQRLYLGRSFISVLSMLTWFTALAIMPLAEAVALSFTAPLFATICAVIILGEVVRARRWTALAFGFLGAMIIVRPGLEAVTWAQVLVLLSCVFAALSTILTKQLTRTESTNAIVTYMTIYAMPISLVPALFVWSMPSATMWLWVAALGLSGTLGHQMVTRAFAVADASALAPYDFVRLPFVALIAWLAFAEAPDAWTWVGAAVIACASAYIAHREATLARAARIEPAPVVNPAPETAAVRSAGTKSSRDEPAQRRPGDA